MNKFFIAWALALISVTTAFTGNWAVLVAGSDGYMNYRHQSDIYHAYQIMIRRGIPKEHIILFATDDIAKNSRNPFPGQVFNRPDGEDVYAGVEIDYGKNAVTPENFLHVIKGEKEAMKGIGSGKVLESTADDNVFIYFSDHGASNLIAFPSNYLYSDDLIPALKDMHDRKTYNKLVFYIEACYSGSMFQGLLPEDWNIYATTAANTKESSYAYYCGSEAMVQGKNIGSCLGDEYSIKWMEHTDSIEDLSTVTLEAQYQLVKDATEGSHVLEFGDYTMGTDPLGDYQGGKTENSFLAFLKYFKIRSLSEKKYERVPNVDMKLYYLKNLAERSNSLEDIENYHKEIVMSARSKEIFKLFKQEFDLSETFENTNVDFTCLKQSINWYSELCGMDIDRDHQYMNLINSFCTKRLSAWKAYHAFNDICSGL